MTLLVLFILVNVDGHIGVPVHGLPVLGAVIRKTELLAAVHSRSALLSLMKMLVLFQPRLGVEVLGSCVVLDVLHPCWVVNDLGPVAGVGVPMEAVFVKAPRGTLVQ